MAEITISRVDAAGVQQEESKGADRVSLHVQAYKPGDCIVFTVQGVNFIWIHIAEGVKDCMVYLPKGEYTFPIPTGEALVGFAPGTFDGEQTVTAWAATEQEWKTYRNLALNPLDVRLMDEMVDPDAPEWSNPTDSKSMAEGKVLGFPHAYANRVTRNEGSFYARNAIDGVINKGGHGPWPYQSWGGAVHEDLSYTVYFGRTVEVDKMVLYLRSDYTLNELGQEHDTYWHTAILEFSDHSELEIHPVKTGDAQTFKFPQINTEWVKFKRMDPFHTEKSQNFAALMQIEFWGQDK